jgi:hypothetical protein
MFPENYLVITRSIYLAALQVYVHYSELVNFFRALSSLLCLPADAGPAAAMAAISSLLQQTSRCVFVLGPLRMREQSMYVDAGCVPQGELHLQHIML